MTPPPIHAIIVTYQPDLAALSNLLAPLLPQVAGAVVVDNGSANISDLRTLLDAQNIAYPLHLIPLEDNQGIAAAQNRGIEYALTQGADFVLLFDQDSIPAPNMVAELLKVYQEKTAEGYKVAAVGPNYADARQNNPTPFIQVQGLHLRRQSCAGTPCAVEVDYLIASGCLIPSQALTGVGLMRENLFIDYVDIEWGLRAKSKGYQSFGACRALMSHSLGDAPLQIGRKSYPCRSPLRHYYMFRNALHLYQLPHIPPSWRIADGLRLIPKFFAYSLLTPNKTQHLRMMCLGVWHGFKGQMGIFKV